MNMQQVEESLKVQSICPKCGFSWIEAVDSLYEGMAGPNYGTTIDAIHSCGVCGMRFKEVG